MGDVVNLRRARKARVRASDATRAVHQRAAYGRTKAEKERDAPEQARRAALLDGSNRED